MTIEIGRAQAIGPTYILGESLQLMSDIVASLSMILMNVKRRLGEATS